MIMKISFKQSSSLEKNDCSVRTLSNALEIPYEIAHQKLKDGGRLDKHGMFAEDWIAVYLQNEFEMIGVFGTTIPALQLQRSFPHFPVFSGMTVKHLIKRMNFEKRYAVMIRNHVFAIVKGEIIDDFPINKNSRIICLLEVKNDY